NLFGPPSYLSDLIWHSAHSPGCFLAKSFCAGTERCSVRNEVALRRGARDQITRKWLTTLSRAQVMSEMDFPSGPWSGFYNYCSSLGKHRMDLVLTFADSTILGDGSDDIGRFVVSGSFDEIIGEW